MIREGDRELASGLAGVAAVAVVRAVEPLLRASSRSGGFGRLPREAREGEMMTGGSCMFAGASATAAAWSVRLYGDNRHMAEITGAVFTTRRPGSENVGSHRRQQGAPTSPQLEARQWRQRPVRCRRRLGLRVVGVQVHIAIAIVLVGVGVGVGVAISEVAVVAQDGADNVLPAGRRGVEPHYVC